MQDKSQTTGAENVVNFVYNFMNKVRNKFSIEEIFISILSVFYALHKGYNIKVHNSHHLEFILNEDKLYCDIVNLIPNDKHLHHAMCRFIKEFEFVDRNYFNSIYLEVLRGLFDCVSSILGREKGEFYTPLEITKLMAYIVNGEQCKKVFDPFCGTASIAHELSNIGSLSTFYGQELNYKTSIFARINMEALYGFDSSIGNFDSIVRWDDSEYDAVVTCPPMGLRLTHEQLIQAQHETPNCLCRSFEEIIFTRSLFCNNARLIVAHFPIGFCFRSNLNYKLLRIDLLNQNLVDAIIELPSNIFYGTSGPSVILVCKRGRSQDEPIKFIHLGNYFLGNRKRTFDYDRFVEMIEGDACDVVEVSRDEICQYDYNLNPSLYCKTDFNLEEGQKIVRIEDLISPVEGERISTDKITNLVSFSNLSSDFIKVLLNNGKYSTISENKRSVSHRQIKASNDKYILCSCILDHFYGINTSCKDFVYPIDIKVYKVNENLVSAEYLVYSLINNRAINDGCMPLSNYMKFPIVIDSIEKQKELVNREVMTYNQKVNSEKEADAMRLGVKQNVSDLEHMLGSTQLRIGKIISRLEKATPSSENYQHLVKSMRDNVEYMNRVIQYNNARIDTESFNSKEGDIVEFITNYISAWDNYGGEYFDITFYNMLQGKVNISFDKTLLTVMLDSILNNAVRHGFHKRKNFTDHNEVQVSLSIVEYKTRPYVLISVANNGEPLVEGFTIYDYISRGRYTVSTGRSGLGGYHVHQIVKGHNGFLYLGSNKVWNMIVDVLLPIESTMLNYNSIYENDCI